MFVLQGDPLTLVPSKQLAENASQVAIDRASGVSERAQLAAAIKEIGDLLLDASFPPTYEKLRSEIESDAARTRVKAQFGWNDEQYSQFTDKILSAVQAGEPHPVLQGINQSNTRAKELRIKLRELSADFAELNYLEDRLAEYATYRWWGLACGIPIAIAGFVGWFCRVQRWQDRALRNGVKGP